jgi:poly(3-hydroxyalkanoate) depolymerase
MTMPVEMIRDDCATLAGAFSEIRSVNVGGYNLRVARRKAAAGATTPLLIFNGIGANLELLEPFVDALPGIEIVTFDVPGTGASPSTMLPYRYRHLARLADRLMHALGYDGEIDVLGVSWGGGLAQQYAYLYPDRCRRLILAATSAGSIMVPGRLSVLRRLANPRRYNDRSYLKRVAPQLYGGSLRGEPQLIDHHINNLRSPDGLGYLYQLLAIWGWTSLPWLHRLRQRTLIMAGMDDPIVPLLNARILKHLIPLSQLVIFDDGHLFLTTSARKVAPVVQRFLTDTTTKAELKFHPNQSMGADP